MLVPFRFGLIKQQFLTITIIVLRCVFNSQTIGMKKKEKK